MDFIIEACNMHDMLLVGINIPCFPTAECVPNKNCVDCCGSCEI